MQDLAGRLANRVQLTADGLKVYLNVVYNAFGNEIDYATLVIARLLEGPENWAMKRRYGRGSGWPI